MKRTKFRMQICVTLMSRRSRFRTKLSHGAEVSVKINSSQTDQMKCMAQAFGFKGNKKRRSNDSSEQIDRQARSECNYSVSLSRAGIERTAKSRRLALERAKIIFWRAFCSRRSAPIIFLPLRNDHKSSAIRHSFCLRKSLAFSYFRFFSLTRPPP